MSAMSNARWLTLSQACRTLFQLLGLFVLSRLLAPSEYGLLAMASVALNFAYLLRDMGTAAAVVQKDRLTDATTNTVFWLNVVVSCALALVLAACAPLLAGVFRAPRLTGVLCALALVFPITGCSALHQALLERSSSFRLLARIEIVSSVLGLSAALALAYSGAGVISLVVQALVTVAVSAFQLWHASRWRPQLLWSRTELRALWAFSSHLTGFTFINFFARNADSMVIGRVLGPVQLGMYSQAYKIMMFPLQSMSFVASRALFPVMCRQQHDPAAMARLYLRSLRLVATITAPMMAGLWLLREPFVALALGPQWGAVVPLLAWLAPVGFLQSLISTTGTVFMATGRTGLMMRLGALGTALQVGAFFIGVRWGIEGVAVCYLVANVVNAAPHFFYALKVLGSDATGLLGAVWQPVAFALLMLACIGPPWYWLHAGPMVATSPLWPLLLAAGAGLLVFGALTLCFSKGLVGDVRRMLGLA